MKVHQLIDVLCTIDGNTEIEFIDDSGGTFELGDILHTTSLCGNSSEDKVTLLVV